jgi:Ca2+-binding RTX toxin-like protein
VDLPMEIYGGAGDDSLEGGAGDDIITTGGGNDTINGGLGDDIYVFTEVPGSEVTLGDAGGNDTIDLSSWTGHNGVGATLNLAAPGPDPQLGNYYQIIRPYFGSPENIAGISLTFSQFEVIENIIGTSANDTITGNSLDNLIITGAGDDTIYGGDGNDLLLGEAGDDLLYGGEGDDALVGGQGEDTLDAGAGNDYLEGGEDDDTLIGGEGDDYYVFSGAAALLGTDTLSDFVWGGSGGTTPLNAGIDTLDFNYLNQGISVNLDPNTQSFEVVSGSYPLIVLAVNSTIENVVGTDFNDTITGNSASNTLQGEDGDDVLEGRGGNDVLHGGRGDDTYLFAGSANLGTDTLFEFLGEGTDTLDFSNLTQGIILDLASDVTQVVASLQLSFTALDEQHIENVIGTDYADVITGNSLGNSLSGGGGNDVLYGGPGNDNLSGGNGNDELYGQGGAKDIYDGGSGTNIEFEPDRLDTDTDGISDSEETLLGTSKTNPDSDGDGLMDGFEFANNVPGDALDPTDPDSNNNSIPDGEEDPDNDRYSNLEEQAGGSDPNDANSHPVAPGEWRTYGDAVYDNGELTVGIEEFEGNTQPGGYHGGSLLLAPAYSYTFTFSVEFFTWDSYNERVDNHTGYWDLFSISVTSLPYDQLNLVDPIEFEFGWGGDSYNDEDLETFFDEELTITFQGDGVNPKFLNLVLDTSNPPNADSLFPSWGVFTQKANMTAHRPMHGTNTYGPFEKTAVAGGAEEDEKFGPGIRINGDSDNGGSTPDLEEDQVNNENDLIEVIINRMPGQENLVLELDTTKLKVWLSATKGTELEFTDGRSEALNFDGEESLTLYFEWHNTEHGKELVKLIDDDTADIQDQIKFHTFESMVLGFSGEQFSDSLGSMDPLDSGMFVVARRLYENGWDAYYYNEDAVDGATIFNKVFKEVEVAVRKRFVESLAFFGHSHGGGAVYRFSNLVTHYFEDVGGMPTIALTAYVDGITQDHVNPQEEVNEYAQQHVNYYQRYLPLRGKSIPEADVDINVNDLDWNDPSGKDLRHGTIDDSTNLQQNLYMQFVGYVKR